MSPKCVVCAKPGKWPNAGFCFYCHRWQHVKCKCRAAEEAGRER